MCIKKSYKKVFGAVSLTLVGALFVGCTVSQPLTKKGIFNHEPVQVISTVNGVSSKTSELTNSVGFGSLARRTFPSIAETASAGGITKIATVEYYIRQGFFRSHYTTIVTGD